MQATKKPHNYHKTVVWQKDDRIRKSPLKFYVYYYNELSGDCQASIFTELWRLSVAFCVTLWHMRLAAPAPTCRRSALHPGDFLMRRKSPKTHQGPPGSWTSGEGGLAPFDPPALYPSGIVRNNLNPQASLMAPHLPRHGLKAEGVTSGIARGEKKTDLPTNPKWQIGLVLCYKPYRGGSRLPQGERERKVKHFSLGPP